MARITVEDCIDKFSSRFELVLVASQRAKKLYTGEQPTVEKENDKNTVIALREIADMTIPINVMKDSLVAEYQTFSVLEEEEMENIESTEDNYITTTENISSEQDINQQIDDEIKSFLNMLSESYKVFGFNNMRFTLSLRPEKRVCSDNLWDRAETTLRRIMSRGSLDEHEYDTVMGMIKDIERKQKEVENG